MKLKHIKENIEMAELYKYISQLEHEKSKRNNGVHHDSSDLDNYYQKEIEKYHNLKEFYRRMHRNRMGSMFNITSSSFFLVAIMLVLFLFVL